VGKRDGSDWNFEILQMREVVFTLDKSQEEVKENHEGKRKLVLSKLLFGRCFR